MSLLRDLFGRRGAGRQDAAAGEAARSSPEWRALGNAALQDNRIGEAEHAYREAVAADASDALAHLNLGFVLLEQGDAAAAQESLLRALAARRPDQAILHEVHFLLGRAAFQQRDFAQAAAGFEAALRTLPDFAEARTELARALFERAQAELGAGDAPRALRTLDELQSRQGDHPGISQLRGNALFALDRCEEAAAAYEHAFALDPQFAEAAANAAACWARLGEGAKALARADAALQLQPRHAPSLANRVIALDMIGRRDDALAAARAAHELLPDDAALAWSYGATALLHGRWAEGWPALEDWWKLPGAVRAPDSHAPGSRRWTGAEPLAGRSILLVAEQGFGDTLQFLRYAEPLRELGARVVLQVQDALEELVRASLPQVEVVRQSAPPLPTDFHIPLMSVPGAVGTTEATIPGRAPYLRADPARVQRWRDALPSGRPLVGLSWSGNAAQMNDRNRSATLAQWLGLVQDGIEFVSLQRDVRPGDAPALAASPIRDVSGELRTFADTAALMEALDLVISVDTSVAHLAGALGRPLWILLAHRPDWRYLLDRDDSPWYPSARLFRQPKPRAWEPLVEEVSKALARWAATRPASA